MRGLSFKSELIDLIIAGKKCMTRRLPQILADDEMTYPLHPGMSCFCRETYNPQLHPNTKPWKSPLFMPASSARCKILITKRHFERLRYISELDSRKEGFSSVPEFRDYINTLYNRDIWSENPKVFVLTFEKLEK